MPRPWILRQPNLASQPKMLLKCHRIQPAGSRLWNPLLGALLDAVWQRRLSCSFEGFPTESQTHLSHAVWNSRPLLSSCSLSFREGFPEIAWQTSDLYVFVWILFLFLILVSDPLVRFSIFFIAFCCLLVCIVISALWSSHSWPLRAHDMNDSEGFYGVPALRDDHFLAELQSESWDLSGIWTGLLFATPFWDRRDPVWEFYCSKCDLANNYLVL